MPMTKKVPPEKKTKANVKKTPAAKPVKKQGSADSIRKSLAKELVSLIPKIDAEGLAFLVKQARIHIYNMQVDQLNKAAQQASLASARSKIITEKTKKSRSQGSSKKQTFRIDATSAGYYLRFQNGGFIFSKDEMLQMVKIVNAPGTVSEICSRFYDWLERERRDILVEVPIRDRYDEQLKTLASVIKKTFKIKK